MVLSPPRTVENNLLETSGCSPKDWPIASKHWALTISLKWLLTDLIDSSGLAQWHCCLRDSMLFFPGFLVSQGDKPPWHWQAPPCQRAKTWTNSLQGSLIKRHQSCFPGKISVGRECVSKGTCPLLCVLYCYTAANILWEFHGVDDKLYYRAP